MAKKLAEFISILNKEDVSRLDCQQEICKVSNKIFLRPYLTEIFLPDCREEQKQLSWIEART